MKLQNTFVQSKLNQDVDERLLPKGQYPDALNIRVANSEGSDVGAIENVKGNEKLTNLSLTNASTIGSFADGSAQKIYWFVTSDTKDLIVEYDVNNSVTSILRESSAGGVLNFDRNYLITGVTKVINGNSDNDLLLWTDDLNPPRVDNIERAKSNHLSNGADSFTEQDIALIKRPPRFAPTVTLTYDNTTTENELENKFYSIAYRYTYLDGGKSPLSSFTNYAFAPSDFDLDFQTMENRGMSNTFNAIDIEYNTGNERVTDIELVFKESGSNTIYLIESINKADGGIADDINKTFRLTSSKNVVSLPEEELFRSFDAVPRKAKSLELIGTRVAFGNYLEQYDLTNVYGEGVNIDYSLSLTNLDLEGETLSTAITTTTNTDDTFDIGLSGITLNKGNRITIKLSLLDATYSATYLETFDFILNQDYTDATELAADQDFIDFVETNMASAFSANYTLTLPSGGVVDSITGFSVEGSTISSISIKAPVITIDVSSVLEYANFSFSSESNAYYREIAIESSVKTNRTYELGLIYMDADSRVCTVQTCENNTIHVGQEYSTNQNKIVANINHKPPYWADRYKFVVKQNKGNYQTIYTNLFYEDGVFRWIKLEGGNINKVKEGDTLIVKSDLGGTIPDVRKVRVLEVTTQPRDFLNDGTDIDESKQESGVYMKIKPNGFDMNTSSVTSRSYEGASHLRYPSRTFTSPAFGEYDGTTGAFTAYELNAGSRVSIYINFKLRGSAAYEATFDKTYTVNGQYTSIKEWFEAEVGDLGSFGANFTWNGVDDIGTNIGDCGRGLAGTNNYISGYGFGENGDCADTSSQHFYAVPHRAGTTTRNITTTIKIEVLSTDGIIIFETEPEDKNSELFYETEQTFEIIDDCHQGNVQNQSSTEQTAIVELDFFNCYVQGNGAESYRYLDARYVGTNDDGDELLANYLNIDLRPSIVSSEKYREVRRYADITYSEPYNENSNLNGLGVFNLSRAPWKEDIEKKYGFIQKLYARDTNLVVFQEDKVSYVLYGKNILTSADGAGNVAQIEDVLGNQIMYAGEYGISRNPESFAFDANNIYFTDAKRGCVCRLGAQGITEISMAGMRQFFKDDFKDAIDKKKLGAYDPYLDQYVLHSSNDLLVEPISMDCSDTFYREAVKGVYTLEIDFGLNTGSAGFSYTFSEDVTATFEYNGVVTDLGTLTGTNTYTFNKTLSAPRKGTLVINASICDTNISVAGTCVATNPLTVVNVILNSEDDLDTTTTSRYKWFTGTYTSPYNTYSNIFNISEVEKYEAITDNEGSVGIPSTGSTVRVEDYLSSLDTMTWEEGSNKLGYLITDTEYLEADYQTMLSLATFPAETKVVNIDGSTTRYIEFTAARPSNEQYLYLIWDYRDATITAVDDVATVVSGGDVDVDVLLNDTVSQEYEITAISTPTDGTAVLQLNNKIRYTHDGVGTSDDTFTYTVDNGINSDTATVTISLTSLDIKSAIPNASENGAVDITGGVAGETIDLEFRMLLDLGNNFNSLSFSAPFSVLDLDTIHLSRTGSVVLDGSGEASCTYQFDPVPCNGAMCEVKIVGRSSGEPIPTDNITNITT